jgi:hypothetical protein
VEKARAPTRTSAVVLTISVAGKFVPKALRESVQRG